jgi:hypothetical protein
MVLAADCEYEVRVQSELFRRDASALRTHFYDSAAPFLQAQSFAQNAELISNGSFSVLISDNLRLSNPVTTGFGPLRSTLPVFSNTCFLDHFLIIPKLFIGIDTDLRLGP